MHSVRSLGCCDDAAMTAVEDGPYVLRRPREPLCTLTTEVVREHPHMIAAAIT
jgi:hypothetical protein